MNDFQTVLQWIADRDDREPVSWNAIGQHFQESIGAQKSVDIAGLLLVLGLLYRGDGDGILPTTVGAVDGAIEQLQRIQKTARFKNAAKAVPA